MVKSALVSDGTGFMGPAIVARLLDRGFGAAIRTVWPWQWSVTRRVKDRRCAILIPDEALALHGRVSAENATALLLRAVDQPDASMGQRCNAGDERQYTVWQWVELLLDAFDATVDFLSVPSAVAPWVRAMYSPKSRSIGDHNLPDTSNARCELGMRDVTDVRQAVRWLVDWFERNPVDEANAPGFVDEFDYALEDALTTSCGSASGELKRIAHQEVPADVHPMAHPKDAGQLSDERGR